MSLRPVPDIVNVQDIPRVLRAIADQVEAGKHGEVMSAVLVTEASDGEIHVFGAGRAEFYGAFGLLNLGIYNLCCKRGEEYMG